jgi:hypothetical protein
MKLSDFLIRDAIITDLRAITREDAIREIVRSVQDGGQLAGVDTETLTGAFLEHWRTAGSGPLREVAPVNCDWRRHSSVERYGNEQRVHYRS